MSAALAIDRWSGPAPSNDLPLFHAEGLTKRYGGTTVLDGVGFSVPRHKVVTFVGENGAGKSTLFNILSGIVTPDSGTMRLAGQDYRPDGYGQALGQGVSRVFQEQSLILNLPVYENLLLSQEQRFHRLGGLVDMRAMIAAAERMVEDVGLDIDVRRRTGDYDFSKRQSIEIVRACLQPIHIGGIESPLILLDEPTSALDRQDEAAFFCLVERLKRQGSLLFVSHRLTEVLELSDIIYVLKDGQLVAALDAAEADEPMLHGLMVGRERAADYYHERRQRDVADQPVLLDIQGLGQDDAYQDVTIQVRAGEVVGLGGLLDSGKSALGKGAAGIEPAADGRVCLAGVDGAAEIGRFVQAGLGYVPAERLTEGMIAPFSVAWNISLASGRDLLANRLGLWRKRQERRIAADYIERLGVRSGRPELPCARLSGGNQQKVVLARWLARSPRVLILDNPTRGVDAGAKEEIYRLIRDLADQGVGILLITDELLELIGLSNRILVMQRGRIVAEVPAPADAKPAERELVAFMLPQSGTEPVAAPAPPSAYHAPIAELIP